MELATINGKTYKIYPVPCLVTPRAKPLGSGVHTSVTGPLQMGTLLSDKKGRPFGFAVIRRNPRPDRYKDIDRATIRRGMALQEFLTGRI